MRAGPPQDDAHAEGERDERRDRQQDGQLRHVHRPGPALSRTAPAAAASRALPDLDEVADDDHVGEVGDRGVGVAVDGDDRRAVCMPTLCWIAPLMPIARYSCGLTILPVWPICWL